MTDDFDDWLRDNDPPGDLAVPDAAWDSAVETAFDPSYDLPADLTSAPGPDPLDEEFGGEDVGGDLEGPAEAAGVEGSSLEDGAIEDADIFGTDDDVAGEVSFEETTPDDDF
ncbi:hypothetical protein [Gordonia terrae]|uniref:hypothetical protein n=1 Tax=Gordonia terrae TaxID=2055 RepID=UPI003F6B3D83